MKRVVLNLLAILMCGGLFAQGVKFESGKLTDALAKAKKENKLVFVDCYTQSCGPCKQLIKEVFPLPKVGKFYNENFINYKLDLGDEAIDGPEYGEKYAVRVVPTFLYLKPNGEIVFRATGAPDARTIILMGKKALGENVTKFYTDLLKKYENGDTSEELICDLILSTSKYIPFVTGDRDKVKAASDLSMALTDKLFAGNPEKFLREKPFKVLEATSPFKNLKRGHPVVESLIKNYSKAKKNIQEADLSAYLKDVNYKSIEEAVKKGEKAKYDQYIADVTGCLNDAYAFERSVDLDVKLLKALVNSEIALEEEDYDKYLDEYEIFLTYHPNLNAYNYFAPLNNVSNYREPSIKQLEKCLKFNKLAFDKFNDPSALGFTAVIMTRLGNKEEAKLYLEKCMKLMKENFGAKGESSVKYFKDQIEKYSN